MGFCSVVVVHQACSVIGGTTKAVAGSAFQAVVDAFAKGLATVVKALMTFWIHTPDPDVGSGSTVISSLDSLTRPLVAFAAFIGLIIGGVRLAWTARQDQQPIRSLLRGLLLMVVASAAGATIVEIALTGFDALAQYVLTNGFNGKSVGDSLLTLGSLPGVGGGLVFLLAFFGMISSLVQVGIMFVRGAILAVLVGILPIAAGSSITEAGFGWFKRLWGWITSFVVYKLVAAVIYAAAFTMIGTSSDLASTVSGYSLIIVSILALPALLRLLPPSAEAMGGGSGGALLGGVAAAATGAVALSSKSGGSPAPAAIAKPGLAGGGSVSPGPTGASGPNGGRGSAPALPGPAANGVGGGARSAGAASGAGAALSAARQMHSAARGAATHAVGGQGESQ